MVSKLSLRVKIFLFSFCAAFLMAVLPQLNLVPKSLTTPQNSKVQEKVDSFKQVEPKLKPKEKSNFILKHQSSIIPAAYAGGDYDRASAYGVVDLDSGEVLLEKNFDKPLPIASITKIMTAIVALDLASRNDFLTVSAESAKQVPSKVMLRVGEKFTLEDLIKSAMIASANDAAFAIKDGIDQKYGGKVFIKAMNEKAKLIGLKNTNFTNPAGFDAKNHYSSVEDLSLLSHYALNNYPLIKGIAGLEFDDLNIDERFYLRNWNGLLGVYPGVSGLKIGNTGKAGHTTIVVSERDGKTLLAITLGAPGVLERDLWTAQLLNLSFEKLGLKPANINEEQLKVKYATWKR